MEKKKKKLEERECEEKFSWKREKGEMWGLERRQERG